MFSCCSCQAADLFLVQVPTLAGELPKFVANAGELLTPMRPAASFDDGETSFAFSTPSADFGGAVDGVLGKTDVAVWRRVEALPAHKPGSMTCLTFFFLSLSARRFSGKSDRRHFWCQLRASYAGATQQRGGYYWQNCSHDRQNQVSAQQSHSGTAHSGPGPECAQRVFCPRFRGVKQRACSPCLSGQHCLQPNHCGSAVKQ